MSVFFNKSILDQLSFDSETSTFTLFNNEGEDSISVSYIPKKETEEFDFDNFDIFVFENNSLIAENDIFLVNEVVLKKGIGWVFPLSALESNDNDYAEKLFFNQYRFLAYQKILDQSFFIKKEVNEKKEIFLLSDLFESQLIIFVLSKSELTGDSGFKITDYFPSFAIHGYFYKNNYELKYTCPSDHLVKQFRGKRNISITKANNPIYQSNFAQKLYINYLKSLDHHLIRFHLLYQVIENHITDLFNIEFEKILIQYSDKSITKNNFIESISKIRNERENIRKVLSDIKPNDGTFEKSILINLKRDCKEFLSHYGVEEKNELGDLLYDVRNVLVHNYRSVEDDNIILLDEITFEFEIIINYKLINSL